jgi:hypothetical protein
MTLLRRVLAALTAASVAFSGSAFATPGLLIGTEQALAAPAAADGAAARQRVSQTLERADVVAALQARGVDVDAARERVAALSDAEAALVAEKIDRLPAGADGIVGTIVFIFVLLLVTDILGFTKVFPFTRPVR